MFVGKMGQRNDAIAIRIETDLDAKQELIDGLIAR
jgi:flagellar motor switch protein FliM